MRTVRLGKTGLEISRVGIGGIPLMRPPEAEAIRVVQRALDLGVTFVDTALGYTDSEIRVGKAVAGRRDQVVIATKGGGQDKEMALGHIDLSLERLNTDYIDLWQFHNISSFERYERVVGLGGGLEGALQALQATRTLQAEAGSLPTVDVEGYVDGDLKGGIEIRFSGDVEWPASIYLPMVLRND